MIQVDSVKVGALAVNCCIVTDTATKKTAVVDPGEFTAELEDTLEAVGYENIEYILLTHGHFDHIGGVDRLCEKTERKAKTVIYKSEEQLMNDVRLNLSMPFMGIPLTGIKADILVSDGDEIKLGESVVRVMHTPGHTPGSVCYICDSVIFSGDTLFRESAGRTDFPTGSSRQLMGSLRKLSELKGDYIVYPGHDSTTTLENERANNPYLNY